MQRTGGLIQVRLAGKHGDADLRGGDELHIHVHIAQGFGELRGNARVGLHAGTDEGNLAHLVVVKHIGPAALRLQLGQQLHGARAVCSRAGEGDIGGAVLQGGNVLQDHVNIDLCIRDDAEDLRGLPRAVRNSQDGDLSLGLIGCYTS